MRGFTLIELIFVIIILAIMSAVGVYYMPDPTLQESTNVLKSKILNKRSNAINFITTDDNNITCIEFNISSLNKDENNSRVKYHFSKRLILNVSGCETSPSGIDFEDNKTICFDSYGRAFVGKVDEKLDNLCQSNAIISLDYKTKEKNITIYKTSGFVR